MQPETIRLSVVIISFNEEQKIGRCLESIQGVADEIIVVDSFSTDGTQEICETFGVRFIQHDFEGHIEQKNYAASLSHHDFLLSLDADEALDDTAVASILQLKKNWSNPGYSLNRFNNYCGKWIRHSGWYPDRKTRLWKKGSGQWKGQNPHDRLEVEGKVGHLKGDILHWTIDSAEQHLKQIAYFTDVSSKELFEKGKKASALQPWLSGGIKFLRDYVWKLGFLDGKEGFQIAKNSAYAKYLKYSKLRNLTRLS